jgi:hypothetical protein
LMRVKSRLNVIHKKFKRLICYLKNLKDLTVTNVKFKGPTNAFCQKHLYVHTF